MASTASLRPPEECAQCGEAIPRHARACPSCGADERTGWREISLYDGLDLPDEADEPASLSYQRRGRPAAGLRWYWVAALIVVVLVLVLQTLRF